jgi:uncharacterized phage protein (TIGR01671 family)
MHREILFRGKDLLFDRKWLYGNLVKREFNGEEVALILTVTDDIATPEKLSTGMEARYVNPDTVCEYTGLSDGYGNKIFENDIIHIYYSILSDCICKVVYKDGKFIAVTADDDVAEEDIAKRDIEVIGNIFDNSELGFTLTT